MLSEDTRFHISYLLEYLSFVAGPALCVVLIVVLGGGMVALGCYLDYRTSTCYICRAKPCHVNKLECDDGGTFKVCRKCAERIRRDYMPKEAE